MGAKMQTRITSYNEASEFLGDANTRKIGHNTFVERRSHNEIAIRLHDTDVVTYRGTYGPTPDRLVILNADGWCSVTTVHRMHFFTPNSIRVNKRKENILVTAEKESGPIIWDGQNELPVLV